MAARMASVDLVQTNGLGLAFQDIYGGELDGGAIALVILGHGAALLFIGSPGWLRSNAWIWLFSEWGIDMKGQRHPRACWRMWGR
jgi:hypothetical protein